MNALKPRMVMAALALLAFAPIPAAWGQQASLPAGRPEARQTSGVPGSPSATTTVDGRVLPNPPGPLACSIDLNAQQSVPAWAPRIVPPKGAPNILLIMTDDVGFSAPSTFGGVIPTPSLDRIARDGLRYTNFHSTALCSPTRAAPR